MGMIETSENPITPLDAILVIDKKNDLFIEKERCVDSFPFLFFINEDHLIGLGLYFKATKFIYSSSLELHVAGVDC